MNKYIAIIPVVFLLSLSGNTQVLGGFPIADALVTATGPLCFDSQPDYVTGLPEDSLWVNLNDGDTIIGYFSDEWLDQPGSDLLLETGFHPSNYQVRCILVGGGYSSILNVSIGDWTEIDVFDWIYVGPTCDMSNWIDEQFIIALDFQTDFGLLPSEEVMGVEIVVQATPGGPDFAGAYIIGPPCTNSSSQVSIEACNSYTSPSGNYTWTSSGSYEDTIINSEGCDSILYIGLFISGTLNASAALITGSTIEASPSGGVYQWVTCPGFDPVPGATSSTFTASMIGAYAAIVEKDGCIDTTDCIQVNQLGASSLNIDFGITIFPNPANTAIRLELPGPQSIHSVLLYDIHGKQIPLKYISGNLIDIRHLEAGTYYLIIESASSSIARSFQKVEN